jgi:signal peptidase I
MEPLSHNENASVSENNNSQNKKGSFWGEIIKFTIIAVVVVVPFRMFIAQPFIVSGASMYPSFKDGEYLIVDQISLQFEEPKRDDVVIFRYPKDPSTFFIKRVIGLPGEKVSIKSGVITIKNKANPKGFTLSDSYVEESKKKHDDLDEKELSDKEYFVMGDNRGGSFDSREWGPVSENLIVGRPLFRVLPVSRIGIFPGEQTETH